MPLALSNVVGGEVKTSGKSDAELVKSARRKKLPKPAWYDNGEIEEVTEDVSQAGNEMFKCLCSFVDAAGEKWTLTTYLTDTPKGGLLLRHACSARAVLAKFEDGAVDQSDLPGPCRMKIGIEKGRGGWPDKLKVEDFAASGSVVPLVRAASGPDGRG